MSHELIILLRPDDFGQILRSKYNSLGPPKLTNDYTLFNTQVPEGTVLRHDTLIQLSLSMNITRRIRSLSYSLFSPEILPKLTHTSIQE